MGTWISHLRIAENLSSHFPGLDEVTFAFGNLSPDSGIPNADWTEFDPPKEVTHFLKQGEGEHAIHDLVYYGQYLAPVQPEDDIKLYSFRLGYFFHLICDIMWAKRIWDATNGALVDTLVGHVDLVLDLAYSPDGTQLASASYDRTVRIWEIATGRSRTLRGHQYAVEGVAWLDAERIATGSLDGTVRVWPVPPTGTPSTAALREQIDHATSAVVGAGEQVASPRAE